MTRPILVTGLPRSGTSWAGRMLVGSDRLVYVNEPLNPERGYRGVLDQPVTHRFQYICADNEEPWLRAFHDTVALRYRLLPELRHGPNLPRLVKYGTSFTLGRILERRALLDDPFALLSARWFAERLGCRVIILVRDPVALAASWHRLGWTVYFHELLEQPLLARDLPYVEDLRPLVGSQDPLAKTAALWRFAHTYAAGLDHPDIRVVGYEDLARDPLFGFRDLYAWCGLRWTDLSAQRVHRATRALSTGRRTSRSPGRRTDHRASGPRASGRGPHPSDATGPGASDPRPFTWTGLSRTAYRPMDPARALTSYEGYLSPTDITRVRALALR
ncbi:sulfotransferase [Streptosporangiaceae bacterium NEAU-GS5]|nr:sulfotransferase [Streptosporangiaceae bacterium NEAU-GS5]